MGVTTALAPQPLPHHPKSSNSKMGVLKKVKQRLRLSGRGSIGNPSANNLPPLLFHQVHGDNIRVSRDGRVARRAESFCKGVTFSARPVKISEKVCVKFLEVSNNWSGVLRFGFTSNDPCTMRYSLPKYACPDLTNKPGYWAKALTERLCERDTVLFYYVTSAGDVHFGINGEEKGIFFSGVDTRGQLWAMIDIYGNSTAIEFLDSRQQLNNRHSNNLESGDVDRLILPSVANLSIQPAPLPAVEVAPPCPTAVEPTPPPPRFQQPSVRFNPLPFHRTRGRNVRLSNDRCVASRCESEFNQGYVFTSRPLQLGERVVVQVLSTEPMYMGALGLGLTSCDPATLSQSDLPDDSDLFLDRPEYWVVSKDVAGGPPSRGDELSFLVTRSGEVQMSRNGSPLTTLMHVDQSLTLWAFLDLYGATQKVRILGSVPPPPPPPPPHSSSSSNSGCSPPRTQQLIDSRCCPVTVTTAAGVGGGTVLVVNLPPVAPPSTTYQPPAVTTSPASTSTLVSNYSHTYVEPVTGPSSYPVLEASSSGWVVEGCGPSADCSVCYERTIDSVLYMCGHMCMCYDCALQQWKGKGGGHCPICRALIRDVIRTFKS